MKKLNKTFLSFFTLGLTFLLFIIPSTIGTSEFYIDSDEVQTSGSLCLSANSNIGMLLEGTYYFDKIPATALWVLGKRPERVKIYLKSPTGETKYKYDAEAGAYGFTDDYFAIQLKDVDLRIPAFAEQGVWRVEVTWYSGTWITDNHFAGFTTAFNVGESKIMDNLMAPIYIYNDMFGVFATGDELSFALPGILWLSSLFWIPAVSISLLVYTKSSYNIGRYLLKRRSGGKKNVKKSK